MSIEAVKRTLTEAKRHERHRTVAETRYWCDQYKQIATEAVKALAKQEQPFADKAASVSNDRIKIDSVTGNVQIGTSKQEQGEPVADLEDASFDELLEHYWQIAYAEGQTGESYGDKANEVLFRLRSLYTNPLEALAKQEQGEPVGDGIDEAAFLERFQQNLDRGHKPCQTCEALARTVMLDQSSHDTTPQQRKPLNKKQRIAIIESLEFENSQQELIDAVEAAHGIKD